MKIKKQFLIISLSLGSLFCVAQETTFESEYFFPVIAKCTGFERQYFFNIIDSHAPTDEFPNLLLEYAVCIYDQIPLIATIKDDNTITIRSSKYTEDGDYNGSGIITKDYLSLDYTISWENSEYVETCHMESIPELYVPSNSEKCGIIFQNPVKDYLTLSLPKVENEIKIFDLQGKLLLKQNVGFSAEIIVSMLPMGTYVLVVNGESYKFVKE